MRRQQTPLHCYLRRRRAIALAATLILLLVVGGIVMVGMYLVENMMSGSAAKTGGERRVNAALSGLERGKEWIAERIDGGEIPRLKKTPITSADVATASGDVPFSCLVAYDAGGESGALAPYSWEGVEVRVVIYDLAYETGPGVVYREGMPPRVRELGGGTGGMSAKQVQGYESMNRGAVSESGGGLGPELGFYLVRSTATSEGLNVTVEQSLVIQK